MEIKTKIFNPMLNGIATIADVVLIGKELIPFKVDAYPTHFKDYGTSKRQNYTLKFLDKHDNQYTTAEHNVLISYKNDHDKEMFAHIELSGIEKERLRAITLSRPFYKWMAENAKWAVPVFITTTLSIVGLILYGKK